jgi:hypothetical protein
MTEPDIATIIVLALALLAAVAAMMAFLKTPPGERFPRARRSLQERLAASPADAQAVILRGDWRRALRRDAPWLVAALPLALLAFWFEATRGDACAALFGASRTRIAVLGLVYGLPVLLALTAIPTLREGIRLIRGGHWPPLDSVPYVDTLAVAGPRIRLRGWVMCAALLLAFGLLAYGYASVGQLLGGRDLDALLDTAEANCRAPR